MIGLVVVSHSRALAREAVALASEMVAEVDRPAIGIAAGLDETAFGTDAEAISEAIEAADSGEGVLVLLDLGSAILSAEMALEFVDPALAARVVISPAPLVEGLVAAVVTAATGAPLARVAAEAANGLLAKQEHLGGPAAAEPASAAPAAVNASAGGLEWRTTLTNPHGLHARPAALLVGALAALDAEVWVTNETNRRGPVPGDSLTQVATLDARLGHELAFTIHGPDADRALAALDRLAATGFGEEGSGAVTGPVGGEPEAAAAGSVTAPVSRHFDEPLGPYTPGDPGEEAAAFERAVETVCDVLFEHAEAEPADAAIFDAQGVLVRDRALRREIEAAVASGTPAPAAVDQAFSGAADRFAALTDPYLRDRAEDVRSLRRLLLLVLHGLDPAPVLPAFPHVLVVDELDALTAASFDPEVCRAVVTVSPATTGHGLIIARRRGIPYVTGVADAAAFAGGESVTVDPVAGSVRRAG